MQISKLLSEGGQAKLGSMQGRGARQGSTRRVGGLPSAAVGRDRRLQMDISRSGLLKQAHLHCTSFVLPIRSLPGSHLQVGTC